MRALIWVVFVVLLAGVASADVFRWGRAEDAGRGFSIGLRGGSISEFQAVVQETRRKLYDVTGETWKQDRANDFDLNDFNVDGSHPTFGLGIQNSGSVFTFLLDANYLSMSSETEASRDYYLSVDPISYNGVEYDHLLIREGESFSFDINGGALEMRLQLTPFTLEPVYGLKIIPFLDVGLMGFVGQYDIEAGVSTGVIQYQNPIENFVVGGSVDGVTGLGLPEYGGGVEVRLGQEDGVQLVLHGHYVICQYDGGTELFTTADHREKNLEIDHQNLRLRLYAEFPLRSGRSWMLGGEYQHILSDGFIESTATDPAEIIELRERFDKEFTFEMTMVNAILGFRF